MAEFLISMFVFLLAHLIPPFPAVRQRLISKLGRRTYIISYSLISIALLVWIIAAAYRAPFIALWYPASWHAVLTILLMPIAIWLVLAGLIEPNPLSISLRRRQSVVSLAPIVLITRHPVLWGFIIWAGSHIPANGDVVSLILFGSMTVLAIAGLPLLDRRARQRLGDEAWTALAGQTSVMPFARLLLGGKRFRPKAMFAVQIFVAIVFYIWFLLQGHQLWINSNPLARLVW